MLPGLKPRRSTKSWPSGNRATLRCAQCNASHDLPIPPAPEMTEIPEVPTRSSTSCRPANGAGGAGSWRGTGVATTGRPVAAASSSSCSPSASPSAAASCRTDVSCGFRRLPVSMPRIVLTETPDRRANSSWVSPARSRNRRTTVAN